MTAAIYARTSTTQDVSDEQRSVARQVEHARAYAARKGWRVIDERVYIDDGINGAEFANRPGFLRLMNALRPRPPFQVLIMSEESRLGREAIETATHSSNSYGLACACSSTSKTASARSTLRPTRSCCR